MRDASFFTSRAMRSGRSIKRHARPARRTSFLCAQYCISKRFRSMSIGRPSSTNDSTPKLIADIGGTNARFALLEGDDVNEEQVLKCSDHPTLVDAVESYLSKIKAASGARRPQQAAMAIAGPITGDHIRMT